MTMKINVVELKHSGLQEVHVSDHQPALYHRGILQESPGTSVLPFQPSLSTVQEKKSSVKLHCLPHSMHWIALFQIMNNAKETQVARNI